jgi:predicted histidine transporter YuiF (NhaC family)
VPANWKGICILALLTPQINIVPNNQTLPVPLIAPTQSKRAIQVILLLIGLGITPGIGTSIGRIASSTSYYNQLSSDLTNDIE